MEDKTMMDAEQSINSWLRDLYRTAVHLTTGNRSRAARIVQAAVNDVWQNGTRHTGADNPKTALFNALIVQPGQLLFRMPEIRFSRLRLPDLCRFPDLCP